MPTTLPKTLLVAGVMSGTSADGIDVSLCHIGPGPAFELLRHRSFPYPPDVREAVLRAMSDAATTAAELARLNWRLGELYADAVEQTCSEDRPNLIGLHGQTIFHQAAAEPFLGTPIRATWQTGEPAVVAERLRVPVVSDFRPADLAAGGQGAPLVPTLDYHFFRSTGECRILLNLGGIANITVLPAGCSLDGVTAFDTGPANMVLDALAASLLNQPCDLGGEIAASGRVLPELLAELLDHPYFAGAPPKSCGREQFGAQYAAALLQRGAPEDLFATAAELTARSILDAALPFADAKTTLIASGGGTRNRHLMHRLQALFAAHGISVQTTDDHALPSEAKEAVAFALLAWLTWHGLPGNVPAATGARHPAILGRITCV